MGRAGVSTPNAPLTKVARTSAFSSTCPNPSADRLEILAMNTYVIFLLRLKRKSKVVGFDRTETHKIPEIASRSEVEV